MTKSNDGSVIGVGKEDKARLFSALCSKRTERIGHKQKYRKFRLNIRKHKRNKKKQKKENHRFFFFIFFFTLKVVKHWDRLPRKVVDSPCFGDATEYGPEQPVVADPEQGVRLGL